MPSGVAPFKGRLEPVTVVGQTRQVPTSTLRPWFILAALGLARIAFGYQFQTVASLAPDLMPRYALSYTELGAIIGAYMAMGAFAALPFGVLARRIGDRSVLGGGLVLMVLGALISIWDDDAGTIALGRGVAGFGAVAMIVLQNKVITDWFSGRQFMFAISVSVCAYPIGVGLAQLVLPPLALGFGVRVALGSDVLLAALALALFLGSFRPSPHVLAVSRRLSWPSARECLLLAIAGATWTAYTAGYAAYTAYVPSMLTEQGEGLAVIALVMTLATWGNVPATLFGGGLAGRFGALRVLLAGTAFLVVGILGAALAGAPIGLLLFWAVMVGVLGSIQPGIIMAVGSLSARPENRAVGMALFYSLYYAGGSVGPAFCGWMADLWGGSAGGVLAAAALSALVVPLFLWHRKLGRHEVMLPKP
jgi:MFS family permease